MRKQLHHESAGKSPTPWLLPRHTQEENLQKMIGRLQWRDKWLQIRASDQAQRMPETFEQNNFTEDPRSSAYFDSIFLRATIYDPAS